MSKTKINSHIQACTLLHVSAVKLPSSGRSKYKEIRTINTLISYAQCYNVQTIKRTEVHGNCNVKIQNHLFRPRICFRRCGLYVRRGLNPCHTALADSCRKTRR